MLEVHTYFVLEYFPINTNIETNPFFIFDWQLDNREQRSGEVLPEMAAAPQSDERRVMPSLPE